MVFADFWSNQLAWVWLTVHKRSWHVLVWIKHTILACCGKQCCCKWISYQWILTVTYDAFSTLTQDCRLPVAFWTAVMAQLLCACFLLMTIIWSIRSWSWYSLTSVTMTNLAELRSDCQWICFVICKQVFELYTQSSLCWPGAMLWCIGKNQCQRNWFIHGFQCSSATKWPSVAWQLCQAFTLLQGNHGLYWLLNCSRQHFVQVVIVLRAVIWHATVFEVVGFDLLWTPPCANLHFNAKE